MCAVSSIQNDHYLIGRDYESYKKTQLKIDEDYMNKKKWTRMSIYNAIYSGKFSSDRTISEYAKDIW